MALDELMPAVARTGLSLWRRMVPAGRPMRDATGGAPPGAEGRHRIIFANQLRGLAALSVVISHLVGIYWGAREAVAHDTATPLLTGDISPLLYWVAYTWFGFGAFGVALFFLISGLVVPISLHHHTRGRFLAARLLRIFPTYMVAIGLCLLVIGFNRLFWGTTFGDGLKPILGTLFLIQDILRVRDVSMVSWTLCIELKFYLVMVLVAPAIRSGRVGVLFAIALATLAYDLSERSEVFAAVHTHWPGLRSALDTESPYLVYMLVGVLFNYRLRGLLSLAGFAASLAGMLGLFTLSWMASISHDQFPVVTVNYYYAFGLFGLLYALRHHARAIPLLDWLAAISFPLYVIHSLIGFSLLKLFMLALGWGYPASLIGTAACLSAIAWGLHVTVERWSIAVGKRDLRS